MTNQSQGGDCDGVARGVASLKEGQEWLLSSGARVASAACTAVDFLFSVVVLLVTLN